VNREGGCIEEKKKPRKGKSSAMVTATTMILSEILETSRKDKDVQARRACLVIMYK